MENEIRQNKSPEIGELIKALVIVQGALEPTKKGSQNPFLKNKYSNLRECWDAARDLLAKNGLAVIQTLEGQSTVVTTLAHESGQWIEGRMTMGLDANSKINACQEQGKAITYGRRYALASVLGLYQEDLDGENPKKDKEKKTTTKTEKEGKKVNDAQLKRLRAIAGDFEWENDAVKSLIAEHGYDSSKDIESWEDYNKICKVLQTGMDGKAKANAEGYCVFANGKEKEPKK